jgi:hypothetical protein
MHHNNECAHLQAHCSGRRGSRHTGVDPRLYWLPWRAIRDAYAAQPRLGLLMLEEQCQIQCSKGQDGPLGNNCRSLVPEVELPAVTSSLEEGMVGNWPADPDHPPVSGELHFSGGTCSPFNTSGSAHRHALQSTPALLLLRCASDCGPCEQPRRPSRHRMPLKQLRQPLKRLATGFPLHTAAAHTRHSTRVRRQPSGGQALRQGSEQSGADDSPLKSCRASS